MLVTVCRAKRWCSHFVHRGKELAWALVTSHNLSKAAWGALQEHAMLGMHSGDNRSVDMVWNGRFLCTRCPPAVLQVSGSKLHIRHYELGALVLPSLEERYRRSPQFGFCASPHRPGSGAYLPPCTAVTNLRAIDAPAVLLLVLVCAAFLDLYAASQPLAGSVRRCNLHIILLNRVSSLARSAARRRAGDAACRHAGRRADVRR